MKDDSNGMQRSAGAGYTHLTIGQTTDDFCAAIIALGKMTEPTP